jgi:hypothetical protein
MLDMPFHNTDFSYDFSALLKNKENLSSLLYRQYSKDSEVV